jgi:hypothetical protein
MAQANNRRTAVRSSARSTMTVANVADTLRPSFFASRYGRNTSPTRAGSKKVAVKPMMVVRKAGPNRTRPMGASITCQRHARSRYVWTVVATAATNNQGLAVVSARRNSSAFRSRTNHHTSTPVSAVTMSPDQGIFDEVFADDITR